MITENRVYEVPEITVLDRTYREPRGPHEKPLDLYMVFTYSDHPSDGPYDLRGEYSKLPSGAVVVAIVGHGKDQVVILWDNDPEDRDWLSTVIKILGDD